MPVRILHSRILTASMTRISASFLYLALAAASVPLVFAGCGSPTTPGKGPQIANVSPAQGTTFGGTSVAIRGSNFGPGATVTFGGTPAANVAVNDATSLTASTPAHSAGAVDIVVKLPDGTAGSLTRGYTYVTPAVDNAPPVLQSLTAKGTRQNEPSQYATFDETLAVSATVTDAETPVSALSFEWSADGGSFAGTGASVTWQAPRNAGATVLHVKITESYSAPDPNGLPVQKTNVVTGDVTVDVHDETAEIAAMAKDFLVLFSQSSNPPATVLHNFTDACPGKSAEYGDVVRDRQNFQIVDWSVGDPRVTVSFKSFSPFRSRFADAWAAVAVHWVSKCLTTNPSVGCPSAGTIRDDRGTDWVTAVYEATGRRWWLCDSDYEPQSSTAAAARFAR